MCCSSCLSPSRDQKPGRSEISRKVSPHWVQMYVRIFCLYTQLFSGRDITSGLHRILQRVSTDEDQKGALFREPTNILNLPDAAKNEIIVAGEKSLLCLYNCRSDKGLDSLRCTKFCQKVATGTTFLQPESLPPTSTAASYHIQRVYI